MGLINDILEDSLPGVVVGAVATAILLPLVAGKTAVAAGASAGNGTRGRGRPLLKAAVRGYVTVADRLKEATAEAREQLSDLAAEVRAERETTDSLAAETAENPAPAATKQG
jgi:Protein of unknown function (DUF5132)